VRPYLKNNLKSKKDWRHVSNGRALAQQGQCLEFKLLYCQKMEQIDKNQLDTNEVCV
jgi:alpha-galactosidase